MRAPWVRNSYNKIKKLILIIVFIIIKAKAIYISLINSLDLQKKL